MKKGFTLIELLAVVVILGIISTVTAVSYTTINNRHKYQSCLSLKGQLENSAIEYVQDNNIFHNAQSQDDACGCSAGFCYCVTYEMLINNGYLEGDLKNPKTNNNLDGVYIKVEYIDLNYKSNVTSNNFC